MSIRVVDTSVTGAVEPVLEIPEGECVFPFLRYAFNVEARCSERLGFVLPAILTIGLRVDDIDCVVLDDIDYVVIDGYANLFTPHYKNFSLVEKLVEIVLEGETRVLADSMTVVEIFNLEFKQELFKKVQFELNQFGLELKTFQIASEIDEVNKIVSKQFQNGRTAEVNTELGKVNTFWYLPPQIRTKVGLLSDGFLSELIGKYERKIAFSLLEKQIASSRYKIEKQAEASRYKNKLEREKQKQARASFYEIQKQVRASFYESHKQVRASLYESTKQARASLYESTKQARSSPYESTKHGRVSFYENTKQAKEIQNAMADGSCQHVDDAELYANKKKEAEGLKALGDVQGGGVCLQTLVESLTRDYVAVRNYLQSMGVMFQEVAKIKAE